MRPLYERAVSNLDRSMHRSLWVLVAHSSFIEGSRMTKNTASALFKQKVVEQKIFFCPINLSTVFPLYSCPTKFWFFQENSSHLSYLDLAQSWLYLMKNYTSYFKGTATFSITTLSITTLSIMAEYCYSECHLSTVLQISHYC